MSTDIPKPQRTGATRDASLIVPALTLEEWRERTRNATRPITDPTMHLRTRSTDRHHSAGLLNVERMA